MKAKICELFYSIQGEGFNIGKPSIFIRFWGCNLRCAFKGIACDTPYSVTGNEYTEFTTEQLITQLKKIKCKHIVWTGGEPTLYQGFITNVMKKLPNYTSEIETNATIPINKELAKIITIYTLSVKLKSSNQINKNYDKLRINHNAIKTFPKDKSYFKFVINKTNDIKEIVPLYEKYKFPVYLMPEGMTQDEVLKNSILTVDLCLKYNFRFSPREHINIWGAKRGV